GAVQRLALRGRPLHLRARADWRRGCADGARGRRAPGGRAVLLPRRAGVVPR
ncbi:unnamed protein product, partial [Prorocentrum cordatum]